MRHPSQSLTSCPSSPSPTSPPKTPAAQQARLLLHEPAGRGRRQVGHRRVHEEHAAAERQLRGAAAEAGAPCCCPAAALLLPCCCCCCCPCAAPRVGGLVRALMLPLLCEKCSREAASLTLPPTHRHSPLCTPLHLATPAAGAHPSQGAQVPSQRQGAGRPQLRQLAAVLAGRQRGCVRGPVLRAWVRVVLLPRMQESMGWRLRCAVFDTTPPPRLSMRTLPCPLPALPCRREPGEPDPQHRAELYARAQGHGL